MDSEVVVDAREFTRWPVRLARSFPLLGLAAHAFLRDMRLVAHRADDKDYVDACKAIGCEPILAKAGEFQAKQMIAAEIGSHIAVLAAAAWVVPRDRLSIPIIACLWAVMFVADAVAGSALEWITDRLSERKLRRESSR